jgi:hypothetical protein
VERDFKELLSILNEDGVKYLIVGGYAVIKHTEPRYTKDLDIWVSRDKRNAERLFKSLHRFGAPLKGLSPADFTKEGFFYTMGMAPLRLDILLDLKKLDFDQCWKRRVESDLSGVTAHFISAADLIINKEAVGRHQDLADAEKLRLAQQPAKKGRTNGPSARIRR